MWDGCQFKSLVMTIQYKKSFRGRPIVIKLMNKNGVILYKNKIKIS